MTETAQEPRASWGHRTVAATRVLFSLKDDKAEDGEIDKRLREGVQMRGAQLWVLVFAIFIASVGLNVNSTAVIIGAMLVSPLMGPITGLGYGAGIYDGDLIRVALKSLGVATLIALVVSTAYFLVSPLRVVQPELLARTTPTLWDVLIALFGGLAGIVGATRREKSNVIPGVAIATALMPPLCTAGFGLATANWAFFFGALYLFIINCVFIAASSALIVWLLDLPQRRYIDERASRRIHGAVGVAVLLTVLPSLFLAYQLVQQELFRSRATRFVERHLESRRSHIVATTIDASARRIETTLVGDVVSPQALAEVGSQLAADGLAGAELKVYQTGDQHVDVSALKSSLLGEVLKQAQSASGQKNETIEQLRAELAPLKAAEHRFDNIPSELHALYAQIDQVLVSQAPEWSAGGGWSVAPVLAVRIHSARPLTRRERGQIEEWLRARLKADVIRLDIDVGKN